uniref:Transient receptor ion channel domain-containing protein n=1 Tax=Acrobeloides nanus TaxID=290746 RepID=A0A914DUS0_9BILA
MATKQLAGTKSWPNPPNGNPAFMASPKPNQRRPRSKNRAYGTTPAVHIKTHDMLNPQERKFLEAAERGDRPTLISSLSQNVPLNINAVDAMGRTALEVAVDNENVEIVDLLLRQEGIRIGNALLCAVREGVYKLVEMLVSHPSITKDILGDGWSGYLDPSETATSEYSSDISPIILAAHLNRFEILQMLLHKDATIERPHKHSCTCDFCDLRLLFSRLNDSLHHSLKRINVYRALASPAWMSLTSSDPILSAFKLSWELQNLAKLEHEFKDAYLELSEQCKEFACDLLSQCRSSEEVIAVLNKEDNANDDNIDICASKLSLSRLKLAIKYEQKTFVSHPHCQQLLTSIWYEGFPGRQERGSIWNFILILVLIFLWPILALCYVIAPKSSVGRIVRSPFMKFLYYSISFGCFLLLLTLVTFEGYRDEKGEIKGGGETRASDRGPPATVIEMLIFIWVIGMLWSEVKQIWEEGFIRYVYQWWNWLDGLMMIFYLCTISLRLSAYWIYVINNEDNHVTRRYVIRTHWDAYEPMLVSEALFAISLGCMLIDVAKFCFIFALIISSFSIGLAQLYWYYDPYTPVCITPDNCRMEANAFSSIAHSYMTLLWSLFSITKVEDTDVAEDHYLTQWVGRGMFIMYHVTSIIILLNILIAMMSHSFQTINDASDLEWKFHRTKLWMAHFDEGSSLPPPFNIIVTPKTIYYTFIGFMNTIRWLFGRYNYSKTRNRATIRRPGYSRKAKELEKANKEELDIMKPLTYSDIIQRLVSRFIHQSKKDMKVNDDDLSEIKQDISSLRYELRDDRRKEIVRSSSHINAVKKDILRTMSSSIYAPLPRSRVLPKTSVTEESDCFYDGDSDLRSQPDFQSMDLAYVDMDQPSSDDSKLQLQVPDSPAMQPIYRSRPASTQNEPEISGSLNISIGPSGCENTIELEEPNTPDDSSPLEDEPTSLEALQKLRESMNERIDQLMTQLITMKAANRAPLQIDIEKSAVDRRSSMKHPTTPKTPRTSQSPARVSFQEDSKVIDK